MTDFLLEGGLALNADVPHPPFGWRVSVPGDESWSVLDSNPNSWQRSLDRLVDQRFAGTRLRTAERRTVIATLAELVAACQQAGALFTLVQIATLPSGQLSTSGLHIAWYDSTPDRADAVTVRRALSSGGIVEEHDTPIGPILLHREPQSVRTSRPGFRVAATSMQAFRPLGERCWTAVVATSSAHPALTEYLHDVVLAVAGSITPEDDSEHDGPPAEPGPDPSLSSIARSFDRMLTHRIEPDAPTSKPIPGGAGGYGQTPPAVPAKQTSEELRP
jgi:hypothetical protein